MKKDQNKGKNRIRELSAAELEQVNGGAYAPGQYRAEAVAYLRAHLDEGVYARLESSGEVLKHPYVTAKIYLSRADWEKYVFIEQHGSLDGYGGL